jgi:hypothetical protein
MTPRRTPRAVLLAMLCLVLSLSACGLVAEPSPRAGTKVFGVGDCVEIPSTAPDTLHADAVDCSADPSYTVGALANDAGLCPSNEYQQMPSEFADDATSRLCLVPNLVADHCYVMEMPIGVMVRADCTDRDQQGVLVQVTQRLDVRDQQACPSDVGHFAWPYPSPPRTYCTLTVF